MHSTPTHCSLCRRPFGADGPRRLAMLEFGRAVCSYCIWSVEHPEADRRGRSVAARTPRALTPAASA
jgi:hypothetical protein